MRVGCVRLKVSSSILGPTAKKLGGSEEGTRPPAPGARPLLSISVAYRGALRRLRFTSLKRVVGCLQKTSGKKLQRTGDSDARHGRGRGLFRARHREALSRGASRPLLHQSKKRKHFVGLHVFGRGQEVRGRSRG